MRSDSLRCTSKDPGTDLTVGLADDHLWAGGGTTAGNGIYCQPNIPTEECFTTPHKRSCQRDSACLQTALASRNSH